MDATAEARIDANIASINENISKIFDRMGDQTERIAKVEGRQDGFDIALKTQKDDVIKYETDHTGPGGDHDRISNFHVTFVVALITVAGICLSGLALLWMH